VWARLRGGWAFISDASADAMEILEGPNGLLWVLVIIIALVLIT